MLLELVVLQLFILYLRVLCIHSEWKTNEQENLENQNNTDELSHFFSFLPQLISWESFSCV